MDLFLTLGVIFGVAFYLNYKMGVRNRRHEEMFETHVIEFDQAVQRNDLPEIERLGRELLYNTSVTMTVVNRVEAKAIELSKNYPEFEILKNEIMNKKLRWNALDDHYRNDGFEW